MANEVIDALKQARKTSIPFLAVNSNDQVATLQAIKTEFETPKDKESKALYGPVVAWDVLKGFYGLGEDGEKLCAAMTNPKAESYQAAMHKAIAAMGNINQFPNLTYLILVNSDEFLDNAAVVQAINNVRTHITKNQKQIVFLGLNTTLPAKIAHDVIIVDEELPTVDEHKALTERLCKAFQLETPDYDKVSSALRGLTLFGAEQVIAMSAGKSNGKRVLDLKKLWGHKKNLIENTPGLKMIDWSITFDDVGGLDAAKTFFTRLFNGPQAPRLILLLDELEKMLGGLSGSGDNTGITQDMLGYTLKFMENHKHSGNLSVGVPGTGKSFLAQAIASTFRVPLIEGELGDVIDSKAGESQKRLRKMYSTIQSIAGDGGVYVFATCNRYEILPPELRRRLNYGTFFFDLPDENERQSVAKLQAPRFDINGEEASKFFGSKSGWSSANIRDCLRNSQSLNCGLLEASQLIIPAEVQDREGVDKLRKQAHNRFLSASYAGPYKLRSNENQGERTVEL